MNNNLKLKKIDFKVLGPKLFKQYGRHIAFAALLIVLLTYVLVVMKISELSKTEPASSQTTSSSALTPRVNQQAIDRIQALENNSPQVHSLFEKARNNPFQE